MKLVSVIKSYAGRQQDFGSITIKPWFHAEVPHEVMKELSGDVKLELERAVKARYITIQMVADGKPVDQINEPVVLQMKGEADKQSDGEGT